MRAGRTTGGDAGQAAVLMLAVVALVAAVCVGLIDLGGAASRRTSAQAAADAAALAGAAQGEDAARRVAAADGAQVVAYRSEGTTVHLTVVRHGARATASARWMVDPQGDGYGHRRAIP